MERISKNGRICKSKSSNMKTIIYLMTSAIIMVVSCQRMDSEREGIPEDLRNYRTLTVGVADNQKTKVGFDENNSFYWHKGDKIGVMTSAGFKEMTLDDRYQGKASGVFVGEFEEEFGDHIVFPSGAHSLDGDVLTYVLPASYTYASITGDVNSFNPPMFGGVSGSRAELLHLASFFKVSVNNIPAGGDDMKFIFSADKRIAGEFEVPLSGNPPVLQTDDQSGQSVTINFSNDIAKATGVFYVPAPLGTYGYVKAEIRDGEQTIATRTWTDQIVKRKTPKRGTMDVDYVAEINGVVYQSLQSAVDMADGQVINVDHDIVLDAPVVLAQGETAVIDLNGNTISATATSASASSLFSVRSGADLTIKEGSVVFAATAPDTQWGGEGQPPYPGYANNTIRNEGNLTLENVYIENKTLKGGASYVIDNYNGARLTVNDGCTIVQSGGDIAIRMFNGSAGEIDVTINGGTVTGYRAVWIQLASNNTSIAPTMRLTVNGGTLTSVDNTYNQAVYSYSFGNDMSNVFINVSGGLFNGDIALTGGANKTNLETVNISGGTFDGLWGGVYSYGAEDKAVEAITITGGTFSADPTAYLAEGYEAVQVNDKWEVRLSQ